MAGHDLLKVLPVAYLAFAVGCGPSTGIDGDSSSADGTSHGETSSTNGGGTFTTSGATDGDGSAGTTNTEGSGTTSSGPGGSSGSGDTGQPVLCGNGTVDEGEECDDGNTESLDGCSQWCLDEGSVVQLCAGSSMTCALLAGGNVKCWGSNENGRLGLGDTEDRGDEPDEMGDALPLVDVGMAVEELACAGSSACVRSPSGMVKCWGWNNWGGLGLGDTEDRGDGPGEMGDALPEVDLGEPAVALAVGGPASCAVLESGAVKCWGANGNGKLGLGDTEPRGDEPGEMGNALPTVDLGGMEVAQLSARGGHNCASDRIGRIRCWGSNHWGQLGYGDKESRGDAPGEMGEALPFVELGLAGGAGDVSAAGDNTCAVLLDGRLKCWGSNGALINGFGGIEGTGDEPGEMGDALPAYNLGDGAALDVVIGGKSIACVLLDDGRLVCWGSNAIGQGENEEYGVLGQGHDQPEYWHVDDPVDDIIPVDLGTDEIVVDFVMSRTHGCALLDGGNVKCWGDNRRGQLGYGDTENRGDEPGEMGDALPYVEID